MLVCSHFKRSSFLLGLWLLFVFSYITGGGCSGEFNKKGDCPPGVARARERLKKPVKMQHI